MNSWMIQATEGRTRAGSHTAPVLYKPKGLCPGCDAQRYQAKRAPGDVRASWSWREYVPSVPL
jgi:hypothetical protein